MGKEVRINALALQLAISDEVIPHFANMLQKGQPSANDLAWADTVFQKYNKGN